MLINFSFFRLTMCDISDNSSQGCVSRDSISGSTKWLRRCNGFETVMDKIQSEAGVMLTSYCLTVNSKEPILKEEVKKAMQLLYR